jgi:nucleoside-diphosphate-sugar epimerase
MNVFVLGGQGFVGSAFVRAAAKRHEVTAITLDNYAQIRGRSCDLLINANGNSKKFLAEQDPAAEFDASVASVLRSLLDFPCKRYVYLSTIDVYPRVDGPRFNRETAPIDPARLSRYGLHKFLAEQLVRKYADRWLICRLGGMVGDGLWKNSIYDILHDQPLRVHAESEYQFMNTDDVAKIVLTLARGQSPNDVFNVCAEGCVSLAQVCAMAGKAELRYAAETPRQERYEVSVAKLRQLVRIPKTRDSVADFIQGWQHKNALRNMQSQGTR